MNACLADWVHDRAPAALEEHQMCKLQELVGLSAPDKITSAKLSCVLHALGRYRRSAQEKGSQHAAKTIFVIQPDVGTSARPLRLDSQAQLDRILWGNAVLIKCTDMQTVIINFDQLEDGGEYVLDSLRRGTAARLDNCNLERNRDSMARARVGEFSRTLHVEYSAQRRAELAPGKRSLMKGKEVVAEADVVLHLPAGDPADDEYVLGNVKTLVTDTSDIDALVDMADEFAAHAGFKDHAIHLAFFAVYVPENVLAPLIRKCKKHGVHLYVRSGSAISRVVL